MSVPAHCQLIGRWRIVEADLWDRDYLDLVAPAAIVIGADNHGEIAFGAMQASLDLGYSPSMVFFTWAGFDEMDEVTGDGSAELLDDGSIEITFAYHNGISSRMADLLPPASASSISASSSRSCSTSLASFRSNPTVEALAWSFQARVRAGERMRNASENALVFGYSGCAAGGGQRPCQPSPAP